MNKIVKNTTFPNPLDLLAPHSCLGCGHLGTILCDRCKNNILSSHTNTCPNCQQLTMSASCPNCRDLPPIYTIGPRHALLDALIHAYKYDSVRALAPVFAELLDQVLPTDLPKDVLIVPLPTSTKHIRERSLDHTLLIAKKLARRRHWSTAKLLTRAKNTVQVGSSKSARLSQANSAYRVADNIALDPHATYLLFDDIWTTGASMLAALDKLHQLGIKNDHIIITLLAYSTLSN